MSSIRLIHEGFIAEHWPCAIEYNDLSGLTEEDCKQLDEWLEDFQDSCIFEYEKTIEFRRDEISKLMADCIKVKVYHKSNT